VGCKKKLDEPLVEHSKLEPNPGSDQELRLNQHSQLGPSFSSQPGNWLKESCATMRRNQGFKALLCRNSCFWGNHAGTRRISAPSALASATNADGGRSTLGAEAVCDRIRTKYV